MTLPADPVESSQASADGETSGRRKRKRRPAPPNAGWTVRYAIVALVAVVIAAILEGLVLRALLGRGPLRIGIGGLLLDATMLASLVPLYRRRRFKPEALGLRRAPLGRSIGLVWLGLVTVAITNALWLQGVLGRKQPDSLGITLRGTTVALAVAGIFIALSAPITEEIFFRGLLYRALRNRLSVPVAAAIAGILFGLVHGLSYPLNTLPPRMVFGVIACLLYEETGSLLPGIALHWLIDAGGFEVAVTGHNRFVFPIFLLASIVLGGYSAVRRRRSPPPTQPPPPAPDPGGMKPA